MNISEVSNAFKVGDFKINNQFLKQRSYKKIPKQPLLQTNLIEIEFTIEKTIKEKKNCHVYFFCVNGIIHKIGGSNMSVEDNLDYYVNQAITGGFSPSRFNCHMLIYGSLKNNKEVSVHAITYDNINAVVKELNGRREHSLGLNSEELERICKNIYKNSQNKYPDWNLQEDGDTYSDDVLALMNSYREFRKNKKHKALESNLDLIAHFRRCEDYNFV